MREILIGLLIFSILGLFIETLVVYKNLKTKLHTYLFLNCLAMLINNTGYLLQLLSKTQEEYISSLKFSYFGRIWVIYSLFMFTVELCHIKIPKIIARAPVFIDVASYFAIITLNHHSLYYKNYHFTVNKGVPVLITDAGIMHDVYMQCQIVMIILALYWIIYTLRGLVNERARKRLKVLLAGFLLSSMCFIFQISHTFSLTNRFDITQYGNIAITVSMFIVIFKYNLLGIIDAAKEYIIDSLSEGVIAVDDRGVVKYYNDHARLLYPLLDTDPAMAVEEVKEAVLLGETIYKNERYYTLEEKELTDKGEYFGKLYALVDTTVLKQNEYKLKSEAAALEKAAVGMKERLLSTEELIQQDRALRHDRRHFEALILSLLRDGKTEDAKRCLEERMNTEPRYSTKYCDNATVNAALTHYVNVAEKNDINIKVATHIPNEVGVDEMKLAIAISNLIENAIHACEKQTEGSKYIDISSKFKNQLLFEITNSCDKKVVLDDDGHPFSLEAGHGIGTRSILSFIEETDSDIRYIAEDNRFTVRMIIG